MAIEPITLQRLQVLRTSISPGLKYKKARKAGFFYGRGSDVNAWYGSYLSTSKLHSINFRYKKTATSAVFLAESEGLQTCYVFSLWAFLAWLNVELYTLTFSQGFET